jgi:DNA helicase HerA-like ATPase
VTGLAPSISRSGPLINLGIPLASGEGIGYATPTLEVPLIAFRRHVCILGKSGAGKSVTGMILAQQLSKHCSVLVLDRTGEFANSLGHLPGTTVYEPGRNLIVSPFTADNDDPEVSAASDFADEIEQGISLMEHYLQVSVGTGLTPLQARVLREALQSCFSPSSSTVRIRDLIEALRVIQERKRGMKGWPESVEAVISRLHPFSVGRLSGVFDVDSPASDPDQFFKPGLSIINLDPLETDQAKNLLSQTIASQLSTHGRRMGITQDLRFVLIVDEAHHISPNLRNYLSVLERYALELRKYGMGLVVIATRPTLISENILANCNTVICHQLTGSKDIDLALNYMVSKLEVDRFLSEFRLLEVGEGLAQLNDAKNPNPVKFRAVVSSDLLLQPPVATLLRQTRSSSLGQEQARELPLTRDGVPSVPRDDSAWAIYETLPSWARQAASSASLKGGMTSTTALEQNGLSKSQVKRMVHGTSRLFMENGRFLKLTQLGYKIAAIQRDAVHS